jgi:hypothetical protein
MTRTTPYAIGAFALCGVLSLLLPRTAVTDENLAGGGAGDDSQLAAATAPAG